MMKKIWIVALCLILVMGLAACGQKPDETDPMGMEGTPVIDAIPDDSTDTSTEDGTAGEGSDDASPNDGNTVDGGSFFGGDTSSNEGSADASTPDVSTPDASTPDQSTPDASTPDASTPSNTVDPQKPITPPVQEEVQSVSLPAAGYDMDGKGRIQVKKSEIRKDGGKQYAQITFANVSKQNGKAWIIPEYSKVEYACYDKNGAVIATGTMPLGALEEGDSVICKVELPAGTVELKLTGHNFEYWTPWS